MLYQTNKISLDELNAPMLLDRQVRLMVLRLDKIHPVVSGNKIFKLHYFFAAGHKNPFNEVLTFGGAFSNHLVATAYACEALKLSCIGVVRGERPATLSHTLQTCINLGMTLQFVSRHSYQAISQDTTAHEEKTVIPEGGYHPLGARGASLILDLATEKNITHFCTATGTATTLAGILLKADKAQTVISIPVIKGFTDLPDRLQVLTGKQQYDNLDIFDDYHFGGYAKKTVELIAYMNDLYTQFQLPTDFVYTAKMMYAIFDKIKKGFFPAGSTVVCLHTGGLQGNESLPKGSLIF
jgi:1-aminocyclopropane-1-carboxylate deaminase/D-cysteine desulfhydrase-like pyridoxal-dependent ACC family enzyme